MRRDANEAWVRICDTFPLDKPFTLRQAVEVGFPGITPNNVSLYASKLRYVFQEVWDRTGKEGIPHVRRIGQPTTPAYETWELPSGEESV